MRMKMVERARTTVKLTTEKESGSSKFVKQEKVQVGEWGR